MILEIGDIIQYENKEADSSYRPVGNQTITNICFAGSVSHITGDYKTDPYKILLIYTIDEFGNRSIIREPIEKRIRVIKRKRGTIDNVEKKGKKTKDTSEEKNKDPQLKILKSIDKTFKSIDNKLGVLIKFITDNQMEGDSNGNHSCEGKE